MTTKKTVSFDDTDGNTYELIIDSKKLPKGLYSAIRRTSKKNQQLILVDETDPKIFDDKSRFEILKVCLPLAMFLENQSILEKDVKFITKNLQIVKIRLFQP